MSNFLLIWNFSKAQRRALYVDFWRVASEEKIYLLPAVGGVILICTTGNDAAYSNDTFSNHSNGDFVFNVK